MDVKRYVVQRRSHRAGKWCVWGVSFPSLNEARESLERLRKLDPTGEYRLAESYVQIRYKEIK